MKKVYVTLCSLIISAAGNAQSNASLHNNKTVELAGSIVMPPLASLKVVSSSPSIFINQWDDFVNGKTLPYYVTLDVRSNRSWVISALAAANNGTALPDGLLSLKPSDAAIYTVLTSVPKTVLVSANSQLQNMYPMDLLVKPPFNYTGSQVVIRFTLSQQ